MLLFFHHLIHRLIQSVSSCQLCGLDRQHHHALCQDCWRSLPHRKDSIQRHERPIMVAYDYAFPIDRIIQKFKYEQQLHYQTLLAQSLLNLKLPKVQAIVCMPISTTRLVERGYNQMLVIAKIVAKQRNIPVWQPIVRAAQHSQKGLTRLERLENIQDQFQIINTERRKYRSVLIIDDVVTTGSSVHCLALALEQLGCQHIYIACIAAAE